MAKQTWQEAVAEIWDLFKDTDARFKETDAKFKETDAKFKETDAKFKETSQRLNQLSGLFTSQWGKLIEALVQPNVLKLFQERGLQVHYVSQRVKSQLNGRSLELDLLLENDQEIVIVEVKSTLRVGDVDDFLDQMAHLFEFFPRYRNRRVYAAVAGLDIVEGVDRYAYRQGLFVLGVVGDGIVQIKNDKDFQPKNFSL
jgi:hypothetical protein